MQIIYINLFSYVQIARGAQGPPGDLEYKLR